MSHNIIHQKLDQLKGLLGELERLLASSVEVFTKDLTLIRAAERNFELIVEVASDINTQLLLEKGAKTPDTYKQSFTDLEREHILPTSLTKKLVVSAKLRNILVHEYDFEEDYERFYHSAKDAVPAYHEYLKILIMHLGKKV